MQWIETDRNSHKRRKDGPYVKPDFKSRLVGCGQHENTIGVRTDSPTCAVEGHNLLCSWAASKGLKLKCSDITSAYFQGDELTRLLMLRPPRGGLPDPEVTADTYIVARVPIYGTGDAGRGFWKRLRREILLEQLRETKPGYESFLPPSGRR